MYVILQILVQSALSSLLVKESAGMTKQMSML